MPSIIQITERSAGELISVENFATVEMKSPFRYERVQGRLVVLPPVEPKGRQLSKPFRRDLGAYWGANAQFVDDIHFKGWVRTSQETDRIPDICVYLYNPDGQEIVPKRVPDLIFEFVSAHRGDQERDYIDKRGEYYAIGVREYVIVDRFKQSALQLTWQETDFSERVLSATETYTTPLLPGLQISLNEAFA